jgi:cystathionine gamma-synthase
MSDFQTLAARAGVAVDAGIATPLSQPLYQSTVYAFPSLEALESVSSGEQAGYTYYRYGQPNSTTLEEAVALLEAAEASAVAASGMAAILAGWLAVLGSGDHIVADRHVYGGTFALLREDLPKLGITATLVDAADHQAVTAAIQANTKVLHLESLSNPTLRVADIPQLTALGKQHGLVVTVDNTFASPALMRPISYGVDLVMHSLPKYIGGHSSAMGGVVVGRRDLVEKARTKLIHLGGTLGPFDAWMALHGLKTLPLRMQTHSANAHTVAHFLEQHAQVARVDYPGLATHAQHTLAAVLYPQGTGGMLAFELHGGYAAASRFEAAA